MSVEQVGIHLRQIITKSYFEYERISKEISISLDFHFQHHPQSTPRENKTTGETSAFCVTDTDSITIDRQIQYFVDSSIEGEVYSNH